MIFIQNVFLSLETDFSHPEEIVSKYLKCNREIVVSAKLFRKSVDARKKNNLMFCCSFTAELLKNYESKFIKNNKNVLAYKQNVYIWDKRVKSEKRPVVVGFGPAGMFAALLLARSGLRPIVFERGEDVDNRTKSVEAFFNGGQLNTESNVQFGEGGAGTFSDGKLNTGIKDFRCRTVIEELVHFGAPDKILYDAKPHIGTDILKNVVKNIRAEIIKLGGEVLFSCRVDSIDFGERVKSLTLSNGTTVLTDNVILAIGHSSRDTYEMLRDKKVAMAKKPFAVGVRIEHLQSDIDNALYGAYSGHKALEPASYKLAVHLENGRGVYTFCMCPGGQVINASSENGATVVNGMSNSSRNGKNANSALLVGVLPEDFPGDDVLAGCFLQRAIENKAYNIAQGKVPVTTVGHLLYGSPARFGKVTPTVQPETVFAELDDILPEFIVESLKQGIPLLDKKLNGFADSDAVISAPETRSSSPVRILRDENLMCEGIKGLFPSGEGAGYAGGIVSAAVDGIHCAEKLIENLS